MTMEATRTLHPDQIEEDKHWWFASRTRALFAMLDRALPAERPLKVLDVGCGAGNMIHHLSRYGAVMGIEVDPRPVRVARQRGYDVQQHDATQDIPFPEGHFDLVTVLDVIEHNEDDMAILRRCHRVLRPAGHIVITVPAFMWLWSNNDVVNAHVRRYAAPELAEKLGQVGFRPRRMAYNNFLIFPLAGTGPASGQRRIDRGRLAGGADVAPGRLAGWHFHHLHRPETGLTGCGVHLLHVKGARENGRRRSAGRRRGIRL
jgi:SAM-dependent methyltransferase